MRLLLLSLLLLATPASAQIYRWVDAKGTVQYSNVTPPSGAKATILDIDAGPGAPAADSQDCYTLRCQGERLEQRQARRDELDIRAAAERSAAAPKQPRGLDFRRYLSVQRGMSEGEMLGYTGEPDLVADQGAAYSAPLTVQAGNNLRVPARAALSLRTYTWLPTPADPFTTTITLVGGRVSEIERVRKF